MATFFRLERWVNFGYFSPFGLFWLFFQLGPLGPLGLFELNFPVEPVGINVTRIGKNCTPGVLAVFEHFFCSFEKKAKKKFVS